MQPTGSSIQNLKSKTCLPKLQRRRIQHLAFLLLVGLATSCGDPGWNTDQQGVYTAMRDWSGAVTAKDANAMWEMLSPDAREIYKRELEGVGGVRMTVAGTKAALAPEAVTTPARRKQLEELLRTLPPEPEKMTAQEYYVWRTNPTLSAEGAERTAALFTKTNIEAIEIEGDRATVVLKRGDPNRISWVRHGKVWKFDLKPSTLLALEEARARETKSN